MNQTTDENTPFNKEVQCGVCDTGLQIEDGRLDCGTLQAHWGRAATHAGERYEVMLCEACFFLTLNTLRDERRIVHMFDEDYVWAGESFGRVDRDEN